MGGLGGVLLARNDKVWSNILLIFALLHLFHFLVTYSAKSLNPPKLDIIPRSHLQLIQQAFIKIHIAINLRSSCPRPRHARAHTGPRPIITPITTSLIKNGEGKIDEVEGLGTTPLGHRFCYCGSGGAGGLGFWGGLDAGVWAGCVLQALLEEWVGFFLGLEIFLSVYFAGFGSYWCRFSHFLQTLWSIDWALHPLPASTSPTSIILSINSISHKLSSLVHLV